MFKHSTLALLLGLVGLAHQAQAAEYKTVAIDKSKVTFSYKQMGVSVDGHFNKFVSQMSFDPAKPANAKASIEIELASVDAGSSEADEEVMGKSWFNVKSFPKATFVSTQIKPAGTQQFDVTGKLSIKGQTRDIIVPTTLIEQGKVAVFDGSFTIRRGDFSIGEGAWAKFDIVANDIVVKFRFTALPGK